MSVNQKIAGVLGLDPSLAHTGACILRAHASGAIELLLAQPVLTVPGQPREGRLQGIQGAVIDLIVRYQITVVALESEIWTSRFQAPEQAAVQTAIRLALWAHRPRPALLMVNPAQVKKYAGAPQKATMLLQVYKRFGVEFADHNLADAYVLARIGVEWGLGGALDEATKAQREVVAKVRKAGPVWAIGA